MDVPDTVPVKEYPDEVVTAIKSFHDSNDYGAAVIGGSHPNKSAVQNVDITDYDRREYPTEIELSGHSISFEDAYRTRDKHTYYSGIHVGGFRLTIEFHDASGGGFYRLRVSREETL